MPSLYVANVIGDGASPDTAWRPSGFDGTSYATLMLDHVNGKTILFCRDDTITGPGIIQFLTAPSRAALLALAKTTSPTVGQQTAITNWATGAGYTVPNYTGNPTWAQVLHFLARQINPNADIDLTDAA